VTPVHVLLARGSARFDVLLARGSARFDVLLARGSARFDVLLARGSARFDVLLARGSARFDVRRDGGAGNLRSGDSARLRPDLVGRPARSPELSPALVLFRSENSRKISRKGV
jgi:hypothetical protein